jgi:hypothetical protein
MSGYLNHKAMAITYRFGLNHAHVMVLRVDETVFVEDMVLSYEAFNIDREQSKYSTYTQYRSSKQVLDSGSRYLFHYRV